jgi:hypothetical protein
MILPCPRCSSEFVRSPNAAGGSVRWAQSSKDYQLQSVDALKRTFVFTRRAKGLNGRGAALLKNE